MSSQELYRPVLVVGAGPIGLTAALALRSRGIMATVLEAEQEGRLRPGSRAIYLHNATLQHLENISPGLGFTLAKHGLVWQVKRTLFRGKEIYVRRYGVPDPNRLPPFTSIHQREVERYMYQACVDAGVEFVWGTPVTDIKTDDRGVTVKTENGQTWRADYVVGADGARSVVRSSTGLKLEGSRHKDTFIVVDVEEDPGDPLPIERVFHYQHPGMGGRNVLLVPFLGGWRIDLQLLAGDDPKDFEGQDGVRKWLPNVMNKKYADRITWVSTYQFYQVVANSFTDANCRLLLAGEAAHLFAPFGARGLNSGVPDAVVAVRGIHEAMQADDPEKARQAILTAARERKTAAEHNRNSAGLALDHIQSDSPFMNLKREIAASLAPMLPSFGKWLDEAPYGPRFGPPGLATKY